MSKYSEFFSALDQQAEQPDTYLEFDAPSPRVATSKPQPEPESAEAPGMISNAMRYAGERGMDLIGNAIQFAGRLADGGEQKITGALGGINPGVRAGNAQDMRDKGYDPDFEVGGYGVDFTARLNPEETDLGLQGLGQSAEDVTLGYQPNYTIDRAIDEPSIETIIGAAAENGPAALADMAAMILSLPAYLGSRTQEIAEARVENNFGNISKASPSCSLRWLKTSPKTNPSPSICRKRRINLRCQGGTITK